MLKKFLLITETFFMCFIFSNMKYIKIREVKSPEIGTELAAGIDFFVPAYNEKFAEDFIAKNDSRNA